MTSPSRFPDPKENWLGRYLRVQKRTDAEIRKLLANTAMDASRDASRLSSKEGIGAEVRTRQIRQAELAIRESLGRFWVQIGDLLKARQADSLAAAIRAGIE